MYTTTSLLTAVLLAGGALPFTFSAQQPGQGTTPRTPGQGDSVQLDLKLDAGSTHRFEVSESRPSTARSGRLGESSRDVRPGQPGNIQQGDGADGFGQQPGAGQQGQPGQTQLTRYEIKVRDGGSGQGVTTLEVKKIKRPDAMSGQFGGRDRDQFDDRDRDQRGDRDRDNESQRDRGQAGGADRDRESQGLGSVEEVFVVEVTRKGEIRQIRLEDKDKDKDSDQRGQTSDERGAQRSSDQDSRLVGLHGRGEESTERVRDHLHAILGTGLHESEIRSGEIVYIGHSGMSNRPVEAGAGAGTRPGSGSDSVSRTGSGSDSRNTGQTGSDQRPNQPGQYDKDSHSLGHATMQGDWNNLNLTGLALELQAVERVGQQRIARFRILQEPMHGLQGRRTDQQPGTRSGDQPGSLPRRETGQQPGANDSQMEGGIATYRVEDGLLEQLTFIAPMKGQMWGGGDRPIGDRTGDQTGSQTGGQTGDRTGGIGSSQDRDRITAGADSMMDRHTITIRRVGS